MLTPSSRIGSHCIDLSETICLRYVYVLLKPCLINPTYKAINARQSDEVLLYFVSSENHMTVRGSVSLPEDPPSCSRDPLEFIRKCYKHGNQMKFVCN